MLSEFQIVFNVQMDLQTNDGEHHDSFPSAPQSVSKDTSEPRRKVNPEGIELAHGKILMRRLFLEGTAIAYRPNG